MSTMVKDVMTPDPYGLRSDATVADAAKVMRDADIGDVIVVRTDGTVCGIVTDRDVVVRGVAEGMDPTKANVESICNHNLISIASGKGVEDAVALMRQHNIRRLPVIDDESLVGIVSLGDLAIDRDPSSVLADISKAPPNN